MIEPREKYKNRKADGVGSLESDTILCYKIYFHLFDRSNKEKTVILYDFTTNGIMTI